MILYTRISYLILFNKIIYKIRVYHKSGTTSWLIGFKFNMDDFNMGTKEGGHNRGRHRANTLKV